MKILVLNAGSSSQKSALYDIGATLPEHPPQLLWEAQIDWTHQQGMAELKVSSAGGTVAEQREAESKADAIAHMLETIWNGEAAVLQKPEEIDGVGHRVVHGGRDYQDSVRITPGVKQTIERLIPLAPAHNPSNLQGIEAIEAILGDIPQVAVFDTAFHSQIPDPAAIYPGPYDWAEQGIRRYGFHGISHQYCARRAAQLLGQDLHSLKLIICHLGNGCSLSAVHNGRSIDTTMGFTPLEGLMMGSRSGSIDPGILIHLLREKHYTADALDQILNKESGLKGISGLSGDMRQIKNAIAQGNPRAHLAFDLFIHRLCACIGALLASLRGLDVLVFTAGIGEHSPEVRARACEVFEFLGLKLDRHKNDEVPVDQDIATPHSSVRVLVIHTQEEWAIAQECWKLLQKH